MASARELSGLLNSAGNVSFLERQYRRTLDRLVRQLASGVSKPGGARTAALIREINRQIDKLDPKKSSVVRRWIRKNVPRAFVLGDRAASRDLRKDLLAATSEERGEFGKVNRAFTAVNQTALKGIVAAMEQNLGRAAEEMRANLGLTIRRTQQVLISDQTVRDNTVGGIIRGETGRMVSDNLAAAILGKKITPKIRRELQEIGFRSEHFQDFERIARQEIITVGQRRMSVRAYSNLVARTQSREAHKVGHVVRLQKNKIDHVRISQHKQAKRDECTPFAGKVFYIGPLAKDPAGFRSLKSLPNGGPPFHPNCRHVLEPFVVPLKTQEALDKARDSSRRLPRTFTGKSSTDVRRMVAQLTDKELEQIAPEGFSDLREAG